MLFRVFLIAIVGFISSFSATADAQVAKEIKKVRYRVEVVDFDGVPIAAVMDSSHAFLVNVHVEDLRPKPQGAFVAYLDVDARDNNSDDFTFGFGFTLNHLVTDPYGPLFPNAQSFPMFDADEIGAVSGFFPIGGGEKLLCTMLGGVNLGFGGPRCVRVNPNPAETRPTVLHGSATSVSPNEIDFQSVKVAVIPVSERPSTAIGSTAVMGDINFDQKVDSADFGILISNLFTKTDRWVDGDLNCEGGVDVSDYNLLLSNWGYGT